MRARTLTATIQPRLVPAGELAIYLSIGKNLAVELGTKCGARRQIGRRVLYDLRTIDATLDRIAAEQDAEAYNTTTTDQEKEVSE